MLTPEQISQARTSLGLGNTAQPQMQPAESWDAVNATVNKVSPMPTKESSGSSAIGGAINAVGQTMENAGDNVEKSFSELPGKIGADIAPDVSNTQPQSLGQTIKGDVKAGGRALGDTLEALFSPFTAAPSAALKDSGAQDVINKVAQVITSPLSSSKSFQQFALAHPNAEQDIGRAITIALTGLGGAKPEEGILPEETSAPAVGSEPPTFPEDSKNVAPETGAMPDLTGQTPPTAEAVQGQLEKAWQKVLPDRYYNSGDEGLFKGDVKALANEGVAPSVWENGDRINVKPSIQDLNTKIGKQHDLADEILQEHGGEHNILDERNQMVQKVDDQVKAGYVNPKAATAMKSYITEQMNGLLASENKISPSEIKQMLGEEPSATGINLNDLNPEQVAKSKVVGHPEESAAAGGLKTTTDSKTFNDFKRSLNDDAEAAYHKDPNADVRNSAKAAALMQDHIGESIKGTSSMPQEIEAINAAQSRLLRIKGMLNRMGEDLSPSEFNSFKKVLGRMIGRGAGMLGGSAIGHPFLGSAPGGVLGEQLFSRLGPNIFDRMGNYAEQLKNLGITPESIKAIERAQQVVGQKAPVAPTE